MVRYSQHEQEKLLTIALVSDVVFKSTKKTKKRAFYVAPEHLNRLNSGAFATVVWDLRNIGAPRHHQYFRMSAHNVDKLFDIIGNDITKSNRHRLPVPAQMRLMIALR
jgi:hypothetical protein